MISADRTDVAQWAKTLERKRLREEAQQKIQKNRSREAKAARQKLLPPHQYFPLTAGCPASTLTDVEFYNETQEWSKPQTVEIYGGQYSGTFVNRRVMMQCGGCGWCWRISAFSAEEAVCPNCHNVSGWPMVVLPVDINHSRQRNRHSAPSPTSPPCSKAAQLDLTAPSEVGDRILACLEVALGDLNGFRRYLTPAESNNWPGLQLDPALRDLSRVCELHHHQLSEAIRPSVRHCMNLLSGDAFLATKFRVLQASSALLWEESSELSSADHHVWMALSRLARALQCAARREPLDLDAMKQLEECLVWARDFVMTEDAGAVVTLLETLHDAVGDNWLRYTITQGTVVMLGVSLLASIVSRHGHDGAQAVVDANGLEALGTIMRGWTGGDLGLWEAALAESRCTQNEQHEVLAWCVVTISGVAGAGFASAARDWEPAVQGLMGMSEEIDRQANLLQELVNP